MAVRKPVPKAQSELSQDSITAYTNRGKSRIKIERNRAENRKVT